MSDKATIHLATRPDKERALQAVQNAPQGHYVTLSAPTRTLEQNRLMWPLIADMRKQIGVLANFTPDEVKLMFLNELDNEMWTLPRLDGNGGFVVGQRSSTLSKKLFSELIELMFAWGAKHDVQWSRRSEETREAMA